jgi:hypothetical protein
MLRYEMLRLSIEQLDARDSSIFLCADCDWCCSATLHDAAMPCAGRRTRHCEWLSNRRIKKLEPNELMGGIGYFLQIYSSPNKSGEVWTMGFWEISLAGITKALADGRKRGMHYHPSGWWASPFYLSLGPRRCLLICELLLASSRLRSCVTYCIARDLLGQNLLTHSCEAAKKTRMNRQTNDE